MYIHNTQSLIRMFSPPTSIYKIHPTYIIYGLGITLKTLQKCSFFSGFYTNSAVKRFNIDLAAFMLFTFKNENFYLLLEPIFQFEFQAFFEIYCGICVLTRYKIVYRIWSKYKPTHSKNASKNATFHKKTCCIVHSS